MYKSRKLAVLMVFLALLAGIIAGCAGKKETVTTGPQLATEQVLNYNAGAEPGSLDPALATTATEGNVILANFEGLARLDAKGQPVSAIAEKWDISPDLKKYTFHLRDTKWSNGDPVTAGDFVYAWTRVLDPKTGAENAYQLFYLKNAAKFNQGQAKAADLGIKAVDAKTLEVELENPVPYFLSLTAFWTYMPVNEKVVKDTPKWAGDAQTYIGNGPFNMAEWKKGQFMKWAKNASYWDAGKVKLTAMTWNFIDSETTELNTFRAGQIDLGSLPPPVPETAALREEGKLAVAPVPATSYFQLNVTKAPLDKPKVREALNLALDRQSIVDNITKGGEKAAFAWIPYGFPGRSGDFRETGGNNLTSFDVAAAKKALADAGYPEGKNFPTLKVIYPPRESDKLLCEAVQEMWQKNLGIKVKLQGLEGQVFGSHLESGDFQAAALTWLADYLDPMSFADFFVTGHNPSQWGNTEYDRLIETAKTSSDEGIRMSAMRDAEKILMKEMPLVPVSFSSMSYLVQPYVKDAAVSSLGLTDFKTAWIEKH